MPASLWKSANYNLHLASLYKPTPSSPAVPPPHTHYQQQHTIPLHFNPWLTAAIKALIFEHKQNPINKSSFFQGLCQCLKSDGGTVWPKTLANQSFDWYVRLGLQDLYSIPLMLIVQCPISHCCEWVMKPWLGQGIPSYVCQQMRDSEVKAIAP